MPKPTNYLALDLGAESGRAILGKLENHRLVLSEIYRFQNGPVTLLNNGKYTAHLPAGKNYSLHWDVLRLWEEIKKGIFLTINNQEEPLSGIGIDTWGVDFGLLDRRGNLLVNPYHYRDARTDGMVEEAYKHIPREKIFDCTGIQIMQINTLYQLLSMVINQPELLGISETFLTIPDLFNYWLTGKMGCEFTIATTTQCYDTRQRCWSKPLLTALGIPIRIFPEVIQPGTVLGPITPVVSDELGASIPVIAPACHDTGSAVIAVPAESEYFAWISCGTWSVLGAETRDPIINASSLKYNFTNEGGVGNTFRFSKNIMGLWLLQQCRRTWLSKGEEYSYTELTQMASEAEPLVSIIDPDFTEFLKPGDMPERIRNYCNTTDQPIPENKGAMVRCILESIALKYRWVLEKLEEICGCRLDPIYIVGGGTQNHLLSQMTADATGREVITGPIEATASGNILTQAYAVGQVKSIHEIREIVRNSFELGIYKPLVNANWDNAYQRLVKLI